MNLAEFKLSLETYKRGSNCFVDTDKLYVEKVMFCSKRRGKRLITRFINDMRVGYKVQFVNEREFVEYDFKERKRAVILYNEI